MARKSKRKTAAAQEAINGHFEVRKVSPLTENQKQAFDAYENGNHLVLSGVAGSGKSFIACYLALQELTSGHSPYNRIMIIRSVVPTRDIGFLPGTAAEKARQYEEPYREIYNEIFGRGDGFEILKTKRWIEFTTTSFLRGTTFNNAIIIVDECANMTFHEIDTVMTRVGTNSRVILCGDYRQSDLIGREKEGITKFMTISQRINTFKHIEFGVGDVIRSGLCKSYILARTELYGI